MGLRLRIRKPLGRRTWVNLTNSGVSASHRFGRRVTVSTSGSVWVRLFRGLGWTNR